MSAAARCEKQTLTTTTSFAIYFICNFVFLLSRSTHDATSRAGLEMCLPLPLQPLIARVNREIKCWKMADMSGLKRGASTAAGKWLAITELLCGWRIVLLLGRLIHPRRESATTVISSLGALNKSNQNNTRVKEHFEVWTGPSSWVFFRSCGERGQN